MEWLALWGVGQATWFVFRPILEDLAKDVAKDISKSYVKSCFKGVFSALYRKPLAVATGRALKELLELIQNELLDADLSRDDLADWIDDVRRLTEDDEVRAAIGSQFLDPDHRLDPALFARAWQNITAANSLPDEFSWQRVAKRFARKIVEIRQTSGELKETFDSLAAARMSDDIHEIAGLPAGFDLETYREALIERFAGLNFESLDTTGAFYSSVRLWSVFVPQSVRECHEYYPQLLEIPKEHQQRLLEKGELDQNDLAEEDQKADDRPGRREYFSQPLRPVLDVADEASLRHIVILGDPGSGKSSLLRFLALRWARIEDANVRYTQPLPLLIDLRDYNRWQCPAGKSFVRFLHEGPAWQRLNQQALDDLLGQPERVVLLLDGLDEVFDPVQRESVVNDIHRFSNLYPNARLVVTSRVVGYQANRLRDAGFKHFMLQDLSLGTAEEPGQIDEFLDRWHNVTFEDAADAAVKRERLGRAVRDSRPIAELAGNPLLLTMMAILNRNQELPRDRAELYHQASRVLLHQWDTERALEDYPQLRGEVGLREKTEMLRSIAWAMQSGPQGLAGNFIDGETLTSLIEDYLHTELHFHQSRAAARAVVDQLRARNFILCFLGADSYAFVHRTFLEYFCAAEFVHQFNIEKSLDEQGLIALFDEHCRDDDWREVLRLICGQIDEKFVGRIVEHLATRTDVREWDGESTLPELPLAVYCLCELRKPTQNEQAGRMLMQQTINVATQAGDGPQVREFLLDGVVPACRELGARWPGRDELDRVALSQLDEFIEIGYGQLFWPWLVAFVSANRRLVNDLACSECEIGGALCRNAALRALAEKWPDETTRRLLSERAVQDENRGPRTTALEVLAKRWPDEATRTLLTERAVQDKSGSTRSIAFRALGEKWPDETTRKLLTERAAQDESGHTRGNALRVRAEKWPDEMTRKLLTERAVRDESGVTRRAALQELAAQWPDDATRKLLRERAVETELTADQQGEHSAALAAMHSEFGKLVMTRFLNGVGPCRDPREPISREHIERAAEKAVIATEEIDETVRSLSEHMGWDITRGAKSG